MPPAPAPPTAFENPSLAFDEFRPGCWTWLAVDADDHVGTFICDSVCPVPRAVLEHLDVVEAALGLLKSLPERDDHWDPDAAVGLYCYEGGAGGRDYGRVARVRDPIRVSDLPEEARGAARLIRFPTCFATTPTISAPPEGPS